MGSGEGSDPRIPFSVGSTCGEGRCPFSGLPVFLILGTIFAVVYVIIMVVMVGAAATTQGVLPQ